MLIPLGILATAGAGGGPPAVPAMELISTINGTGSSGTITFDPLPTDYKHLQIRMVGKTTGTTGNELRFRFNSDIGANYARHQLSGNGSSVVSGSQTGQTSITIPDGLANSSTASAYKASIIDILDYGSTTKNKTIRILTGGEDNRDIIALHGGLWASTSAITRITVSSVANDFDTGTRVSLYGIRG